MYKLPNHKACKEKGLSLTKFYYDMFACNATFFADSAVKCPVE